MRMQKKFETNARRKTQRCRTFELKLNHRKFSKNDKEYFNKLFLDAKKMYNYLVTSDDLFEFDTKANSVPSFNKDTEIYTYDFKNIFISLENIIENTSEIFIVHLRAFFCKNNIIINFNKLFFDMDS